MQQSAKGEDYLRHGAWGREVGYKLEAFILNHRAAEMLPDNLRHPHRLRLSDQTEDWVRDIESGSDE